jgi:hypothetical protein
MPTSDSDNLGTTRPSWNGEQRTLSLWLDDLERWLPQQDPNYHSLITRGTIQLKHLTAVPSAEFAADLAKNGATSSGSYGQPSPMKKGTATSLDPTLANRFVVAPDAIASTDFKLLQLIASTITVPEFADELKQEAGESGRALLRDQRDACMKIRPEAKHTLQNQYDDHVKAGISDLHPTTSGHLKISNPQHLTCSSV